MNQTSSYTDADRETLLQVARNAIGHGLRRGIPASIEPETYSTSLREKAASFVTLKCEGSLRGCIGTLQAIRALVDDVNENAYAAAFRDPRFPPLSDRELNGLQISISVLSAPEPLSFRSEVDLVDQLRAGVDGLILEEGRNRGTFLPAVWEALPDPTAFLRQLKMKAGLHPDYWSETLRVYRYHAEVIDRA
jgi:AmmeMemoRadiSam system protein A